jgi:hypothetical protein
LRIHKVLAHEYPPQFILEDLLGHIKPGRWYSWSLIKTSLPKQFIVSKIIRTKGQKILVQYKHFPPEVRQ